MISEKIFRNYFPNKTIFYTFSFERINFLNDSWVGTGPACDQDSGTIYKPEQNSAIVVNHPSAIAWCSYCLPCNHIVAIGHGLLKKFWPMVIGCVLRTAGSFIIWNDYKLYKPLLMKFYFSFCHNLILNNKFFLRSINIINNIWYHFKCIHKKDNLECILDTS